MHENNLRIYLQFQAPLVHHVLQKAFAIDKTAIDEESRCAAGVTSSSGQRLPERCEWSFGDVQGMRHPPLNSAIVLPGDGSIVTMEACKQSLRRLGAWTACAALLPLGIVG